MKLNTSIVTLVMVAVAAFGALGLWGCSAADQGGERRGRWAAHFRDRIRYLRCQRQRHPRLRFGRCVGTADERTEYQLYLLESPQ